MNRAGAQVMDGAAVQIRNADIRRRWLGIVPPQGHYEEVATWTLLRAGDCVEVRRGEDFLRSGCVDELMADGSTVWILADDGGRVLFHESHDVQIWRRTRRILD